MFEVIKTDDVWTRVQVVLSGILFDEALSIIINFYHYYN